MVVTGTTALIILTVITAATQASARHATTGADIIINELMASNHFGLQDEDGDTPDWIELFNTGDTEVDLSGWTLTDDASQPSKWVFPSRTIPAHGYLIIFASGKDRRPTDAAAELHTNFKLSSGGEYLGLFAPSDPAHPIDDFAPEFPTQYTDISYGRFQKNDYRYFSHPTPGEINDETSAVEGVTQGVAFNVHRGFFESPFKITLTSDTPEATIRYTLNGEEPTDTVGATYNGPITISKTTVVRARAYFPHFLPSPVNTNTYIFPRQVVYQSKYPGGFPRTWGWYNGEQTPADYEMDPHIVRHPEYRRTIVEDLQTLPVLSIVTSRTDMFGKLGIYSYPLKRGRDWERPGSIELFSRDDAGFQINAGVRIHGGMSRIPTNSAKHSFRLYFRDDYGADWLEHPIFPDTDVARFDKLVVRANFTDSWLWGVSYALLLRDQWIRDTEEAMGKINSHGIFVNLYVDGLYWGVYNLIERIDDDFVASYYPDAESFDVLKGLGGHDPEVKSGDLDAWHAMIAQASTDLSDPSNYAILQQYLDIPTFIDYIIINLYAGHHYEWPWHNWYALRPREDDGKFQFVSWDSEAVLNNVNENIIDINSDTPTPAWIYQRLRANAEFRLQFADRVHRHFFNGGAFYVDAAHPDWTPDAPERNQPAARFARRAERIRRAMVGESARWGDWKSDKTFTRNEHWDREVARLLHRYFPQRSAIVLQQFRHAGLYPRVDAPVFSQHGGEVETGAVLTMTASSGDIYFTTDGSDPRTPITGEPSPAASVYHQPVMLPPGVITVKARARHHNQWSALEEATFTVTSRFDALHITEIMYHPLDGSDYEFIELHNAGDVPLNLAGVSFVDGIAFTFPAGANLAPDAYGVLVQNAEAFTQRYPDVDVMGEYDGKLSNSGEQVVLQDPKGYTIIDMTYDDGGLWPSKPDGQGYSLVIFDEQGNPNEPANWRSSRDIYGSPGAADPAPLVDGVVINEVLAHSDPPYEDAIELYNPLDQDFKIGGWFLSDDPAEPQKFRIPDGAIIEAGGYYVFYEYQFNPQPGTPPSFGLSSHGETVILSAADAAGNLTGYADSVKFGPSPTNLSMGRFGISTGFDFTLLQTPTFGVDAPTSVDEFRTGWGAANAKPIIGPVVINELMYHPAGDGDEFIELYNFSDDPVPLFDEKRPENTWAFTDGVTYTFPPGVTMLAHSYLLLVRMQPDAFRSKYAIPANVPIFGPYDGKLSNGGERVALSRPDTPDGNEVPYIDIDVIQYDDNAPWPDEPDGDGPSLERLIPHLYGNDPADWAPSAQAGGSPGRKNCSHPILLPLFLR